MKVKNSPKQMFLALAKSFPSGFKLDGETDWEIAIGVALRSIDIDNEPQLLALCSAIYCNLLGLDPAECSHASAGGQVLMHLFLHGVDCGENDREP